MSDLINRQDAIDAFEPDHPVDWYTTMIVDVLENLPSVQPRKGKWDCLTEDIDGLSFGIKRCSMCGASKPMKLFHWEDTEINFCPNCGADMRGDSDE